MQAFPSVPNTPAPSLPTKENNTNKNKSRNSTPLELSLETITAIEEMQWSKRRALTFWERSLGLWLWVWWLTTWVVGWVSWCAWEWGQLGTWWCWCRWIWRWLEWDIFWWGLVLRAVLIWCFASWLRCCRTTSERRCKPSSKPGSL